MAPHNTDSITIKNTAMQILHAIIAGVIFISITPTIVSAADFQGKLNSVSITDAANTNIPPVASFTYTQDDDIFSFDANSSSDTDGTIVNYSWNFGGTSEAEGLSTSYTIAQGTSLQVTLTVLDDSEGVSITQETVTNSSPSGITDDFATDTSLDYTSIVGELYVQNSAALGKVWSKTIAYHKTDLGKANHWIEADIYYDGTRYCAGVAARIDTIQQSGYQIYFYNGTLYLASFSGTNQSYIAGSTATFSAGTYKARMEVIDNNIKVFINGNIVIDVINDTNLSGSNVGLFFTEGPEDPLVLADNLKAGLF